MEELLVGLAIVVAYSFGSIRVLKQYERGVGFFLGRFWGTKGPGLAFVPAGFASMKRVSLRIVALDIPPQDVITRDNVSVMVSAVVYFRAMDPMKAVLAVEDFRKWVTWQEVSAAGLRRIGPAVATLARAEGLVGHAEAVEERLATPVGTRSPREARKPGKKASRARRSARVAGGQRR